MLMRFWTSALIAAGTITGCVAAEPGSANATTRRVIAVPASAGRTVEVPVMVDPATIAPRGRHVVTPIGAPRGRYLLVLDSYASRAQGLSRCQAGQERWARLIDMGRRREIYRRLVDSCLTDVEANDPPVRWNADGGVTLDLLSSAPVRLSIAADGTVTER